MTVLLIANLVLLWILCFTKTACEINKNVKTTGIIGSSTGFIILYLLIAPLGCLLIGVARLIEYCHQPTYEAVPTDNKTSS